MPPDERLSDHLHALYDLLALIELLPSSAIPLATPDSQTLFPLASLFTSIYHPSSPPLAWSTLCPLLEQCFGTVPDVDPVRIEAGQMGFGLVGLALQKLGPVEDEQEQVEMTRWLARLKKACLQQMNSYPSHAGPVEEDIPVHPSPISMSKLLGPGDPADASSLIFASFLAAELSSSNPGASPHLLPSPSDSTSSRDYALTSSGNAIAGPSTSDPYWASIQASEPSQPTPPIPAPERDPNLTPTGRLKTKRAPRDPSLPPLKKIRRTSPGPNRPRSTPSNLQPRTFPPGVPILPDFPRFYRRFPISSAFAPESYIRLAGGGEDLMMGLLETKEPMEGEERKEVEWNGTPHPWNLYKPRMVRGVKLEKEGLCPICVESVERGGEGEAKWLKLKNSSYLYHLSFYHGVGNRLAGLPFSPPIEARYTATVKHSKHTRAQMLEGLCHHCKQWIPMQSVKEVTALVPELFWWKHAKACHGTSTIAGEGDYFIPDAITDLVASRKEQDAFLSV